jgi:perosamine synthetase
MALPSCTSAIHLALAALDIGPGDEVIIPDCTWIASAAPIKYVGATPVFADVDPVTWCLSSESLEECMSPRTRAVIAVDLYGGVPDYEALVALTAKKGVVLIEDAAEAVGAEYRGRRAGALGDVGVFSFHGSKTLTTGEGGMLVSDRAELMSHAGRLRDHGRVPGDKKFWNTEVAFKYKMSAMQAALGLAQLERIDELLARKREAFTWYTEELGDVDELVLNAEPEGTRNAFWMVTAVVSPDRGIGKFELMDRLARRGIDTRPFFHPLSALPAYEGLAEAARAKVRNEVAYRVGNYGVNLPSSLRLTREDVRRVGTALREALRET